MYLKTIFSLVLGLLMSTAVWAQEPIRVGDEVEYSCTRSSSGTCGGRVEAINGTSAKVRWGNVRTQFDTVGLSQVRLKAQPPSQQQINLWQEFDAAVKSKGQAFRYLQMFAHYFDPEEFPNVGGNPTKPDEWRTLMATLAEVDGLCKGQFRGIANRGYTVMTGPPRRGDLEGRFGDWCRIADQRLAYEPKIRADAAKYMLNPADRLDIKKAIEHSRNLVWDREQLAVFEPEKYKAKVAADLKQAFADYGTAMPADFFADVEKQAAELKAVIDQKAPTKSFVKPSYQDAAAQAAVRRKLAASYPGAQIVSIGSRYPKWEKRTGADLTGMGTGYKLYTLTTNFYKAGDMLIKMPNRPFCQMRSWTVRQSGMVAFLGEAGEFMKCE